MLADVRLWKKKQHGKESPIEKTSSECSMPGIMLDSWGTECKRQYAWMEEVTVLLGMTEGCADVLVNHVITLVS